MIIDIDVPFRIKIEAKNIDPLLQALRKIREFSPEQTQKQQEERQKLEQQASIEEQMGYAHKALENESIIDRFIEQLEIKSSYLKDRKLEIEDVKNMEDERTRFIRSQLQHQPGQQQQQQEQEQTSTTTE